MKKIVFLVWMLIPVVAAAYHFGPGQKRMVVDDAGVALRDAGQLAEQEQWAAAVEHYDRALELLPEGRTNEAQRIRLAKAKTQMFAAQLPAARQDLADLVQELSEAKEPDTQLLSESRQALASSQYYITWLMRLEGQPREVWEPEIESSRQIYKLLAEDAERRESQDEVARHAADLESSIRLARMDLKDLQGLPLPSQ